MVPCTSEAEKKKPRSSDQEPENVKKPLLLALKPGSREKKVDLGGYSRASKMIRMAVGAAAIVPQKPREPHQTSLIAKKPTASNGSKLEPKETLNSCLKIQLAVEALDNVFSGAIEASTLLSNK